MSIIDTSFPVNIVMSTMARLSVPKYSPRAFRDFGRTIFPSSWQVVENVCGQQQVMSDDEDEVLPSEDRSATDVILPNGMFNDKL